MFRADLAQEAVPIPFSGRADFGLSGWFMQYLGILMIGKTSCPLEFRDGLDYLHEAGQCT